MRYNNTLISALISVAATLTTVQAVKAQEVTRTEMVQVKDLDLNSPAGVETLNRRIAGAVREVCGSYNADRLSDRREMQTCRVKAMQSAKAEAGRMIAAANAKSSIQLASIQH